MRGCSAKPATAKLGKTRRTPDKRTDEDLGDGKH